MVFVQWLSRQNIIVQFLILYPIGYVFSALLLLYRRFLHMKSYRDKWEYYENGRDPLTKRKIVLDSLYLGAFMAVMCFCLLYAYAHRA